MKWKITLKKDSKTNSWKNNSKLNLKQKWMPELKRLQINIKISRRNGTTSTSSRLINGTNSTLYLWSKCFQVLWMVWRVMKEEKSSGRTIMQKMPMVSQVWRKWALVLTLKLVKSILRVSKKKEKMLQLMNGTWIQFQVLLKKSPESQTRKELLKEKSAQTPLKSLMTSLISFNFQFILQHQHKVVNPQPKLSLPLLDHLHPLNLSVKTSQWPPQIKENGRTWNCKEM